MDSASAWRAEEFWDRGTRLVFGMADETRQPQSLSLWLRATPASAGLRHWQARDEGQTK